MRDVEKQTLKNLGYEFIEIKKSTNVYPEISSHVDIFACKVKDKIVVEKSAYKMLKNKLNNDENILISGETMISYDYPNDIKYNVCIVGNKAIHNFKYTDSKIISELNKSNFEIINVKQGYSNCSIAVIDENSIILSDKGLYNSLKNILEKLIKLVNDKNNVDNEENIKELIDKINIDGNEIKTIYLLNNYISESAYLVIQDSKVKIYDFKKEGSNSLIRSFKEELRKNASVFKFLPERYS